MVDVRDDAEVADVGHGNAEVVVGRALVREDLALGDVRGGSGLFRGLVGRSALGDGCPLREPSAKMQRR